MSKFEEFRKKYPVFQYQDYKVTYTGNSYEVVFQYEIEGVDHFETVWNFPGEKQDDETALYLLFFQLGMVEAISYWKVTCSPTLKILCGGLTEEQRDWWRKLFYNGLGEFMYLNNIEIAEEDLLSFEWTQEPKEVYKMEEMHEGYMVPIGGGKDSIVSLEVLRDRAITTFSINRSATTQHVIDVCENKTGDYIATRKLDPKILEMNAKGFLNGHIPFSSVVAFSSFISAHLSNNKFICLSNESSANESTVADSFVNHQYSKSYEFEKDFMDYIHTVVNTDIFYFSLLRPLTEIQIAYLFSKAKKYHSVFRSCNVGSKVDKWCCHCPKCLFVYIILSPFLREEELVRIFGENLLNKEEMDHDFRALTGIDANKPFECVGTRREVVSALQDFIKSGKKSLLTERYEEAILSSLCVKMKDMLKEWSVDHSVPQDLARLLEIELEID